MAARFPPLRVPAWVSEQARVTVGRDATDEGHVAVNLGENAQREDAFIQHGQHTPPHVQVLFSHDLAWAVFPAKPVAVGISLFRGSNLGEVERPGSSVDLLSIRYLHGVGVFLDEG